MCARLGHVGAGCGVRPGGPRGAGQSAPGLLAVSPAPSAAGGRCLGRNAGRGGVSRRRRLPAAGDSRRSPLSARLQARYRCGFGRSSRFPPLCVQLPVMLSPASSFFISLIGSGLFLRAFFSFSVYVNFFLLKSDKCVLYALEMIWLSFLG